jgi:uncharacterized protein YbjT (DUF2867 family)
MVGEGVLLQSLDSPAVEQVLLLTRRPYGLVHPKLTQVLLPDFFDIESTSADLRGYDACFFCAGVSSLGMSEADYTRATYDLTLHVAGVLARLNPQMVFTYVSGAHTDSSERGKVMWARVKGRTENDLAKLPFKGVYAFRPGFMQPVPGQNRVKRVMRVAAVLYPLIKRLFPNQACTLREVAQAMLTCAAQGYPKDVLEIADITAAARSAASN